MNFMKLDFPDAPRHFATDEPHFNVKPMGHASLVALMTNPSAALPVTLQDVYGTTADGVRLPGSPPVNATFQFSYRGKTSFYGLVPGGWIPPVIGNGRVALLDRNMVHRLKTLGPHEDMVEPESPEWLYRLFADGEFEVSIATHLLEGKWRRAPTLEEMADELADSITELQAALPKAKMHQLGEKELKALHALMTERANLTKKTQQFLLEVAPLLAVPAKRTERLAMEVRVLQAAVDLGMRKTDLSVIAALSCLYDDPTLPAGDVFRRLIYRARPGHYRTLNP